MLGLSLAMTLGNPTLSVGVVVPPDGFLLVVIENSDNLSELLVETDDDGLMYIEEAD